MSRKKTKIIQANEKTSNIIRRTNHFSQRFNIEPIQGSREKFKNRCISAIGEFIGGKMERMNWAGDEVCTMLGIQHIETVNFNEYVQTFSDTRLYKILTLKELTPTNDALLFRWLMILECILNIGYDASLLAQRIAEALVLDGVNAVLCDSADGYVFYPANAELLDQKIVIDVLNWLSAYPKAKEQYDMALRLFLQGDRTRHVLDNTRLAFELFLKQYFNNNSSLENQLKHVGEYLKNSGISAELRNMFPKLIDLFAKYNNNHIKHADDSELIVESEIEFVIYLTGCFMRFLIQSK